MKTYWFMDEYSIVRPVYEDEDEIFSPIFNNMLKIEGDTLVELYLSSLTGELRVENEYQLYNSLAELAATFGE